MQTNLLIDIGNTNAKAVFYYSGRMGKLHRSSDRDALNFIVSIIESTEAEIQTIVVSNVRTSNDPVRERLTPLCKRIIFLDYKTELPIDLKYSFDAHELGADRIASALAVASMFKGQDCIKFDFGTALTIDFIDRTGKYLGGNISLGMRSRFRALNEFTGLLPYIGVDSEFPNVGVTTTGAMSAGVVFGLIFEVEGYIKKYPNHTIILTGGDSFYFADRIRHTVFATQDMVLQGLAIIADYYAAK